MRVRRVTWIGFRSRFSSHLSCHHSWNLGLDPDGYFIPAVKGRVKRASKNVKRASREKVEGGTREEQGKRFFKETETGGLKRCEEGVRGGREGKMGRRKDGLCIPGPVFFYNRPSYTLQGRFPV